MFSLGLILHGGPMTVLDKLMILLAGCLPIAMIFDPSLAGNSVTKRPILVFFIITDTYLTHTLSDNESIHGFAMEMIFFTVSSLKSIYFVNTHFFKHENADQFSTKCLNINEVVACFLYFALTLAFASYVDYDYMWCALIV